MQPTPGLPNSVSITALNLREDAYAVLCLPCGGGGAATTVDTRRGHWARPDAWAAAQQHADRHARRREEVLNSERWHRQAAALGWSAAQADVMWWAARGHLHHDQAGYYRMDPHDPNVRRGRAVARARVHSLIEAGFLDHDHDERGPVTPTQDGHDARRAWNHAHPEPAEQETRHLRPLLDGHEDTTRRQALAERAAHRAAEEAEPAAHQPSPVEPAPASTPDQCPHTPVWLILTASPTGALSHHMECACGTTTTLYPGKSPSIDRGTATRPTGIREASVTTTTGWARQQGYRTTGPWTILDQDTKRAPIRDENAPTHIPLVNDPNRHPATTPAPVEPDIKHHQDQDHADVEQPHQAVRADVEHQNQAHRAELSTVPGEEVTAAGADVHAAAPESDPTTVKPARPVELPDAGRRPDRPRTGVEHTPTRRRGRRPTPKCGQSPPAPTRQHHQGHDTGILETPHTPDRSAAPVIPHGRPALTEDDLAALAGTSLKTWRRNQAAAFRARVPLLCPGDRLRLYDREQTLAHLAGRPLPPLPDPGDHPTDLLTDREAGAVLGISDTTVRAYATTGHLSPGIELYGRRWWPRHEITTRRDAGDQRAAASTSAVQALTDQLATNTVPTAAELAARDGISTRTARRRITAARHQLDSTEDQQHTG
ncbi:hypothetical protein [Streptomyces sp. NPDC001568]|uniref:helix-turn-helix transcriptional regulator n=1 Tax=Streptomyces sp. NPDC001568 TaxID=3364588 RepID=UPI00368C6736